MPRQQNSDSLQYPELVSDVLEVLDSAEDQEGINFDIDDDLIDEQLGKFKENRTSNSNAVKYVAKQILKEADIDNPRRFLTGGSRKSTGAVPSVTIDQIDNSLFWFNLDVEGVTVIDTHNPESDMKVQTGYMADSASSIPYTLWDGADADPLEVGQDYTVSNASLNEYRGELEINLGDDSTVEPTDDGPGVDLDTFVDEFEGCAVDFHDPTGLISRCQNPGCGRSLEYDTDECVECRSSDIEPELLAKAILDTGEDTVTAFFYREQVSKLIDRSLDECIKAAKESGVQIVRDQIEANLHGSFIAVKGSKRRQNFYVDELEFTPAPTVEDIEALADELQAVGEE